MVAKNVLLITSDSFDIKFFSKKIDEMGLVCKPVLTNKEVEDALNGRGVSVVLFNYSTRGFSLNRLIKFLTDNIALEPVPIIVIVAPAEVEQVESFLNEFSEDFLIRPFSPQVLVIKLRSALRKKHSMDEIRNNLRAIQDRNNKDLYEEKLGILKEITTNLANEIKDPVNFLKNFSEIAINNAKALVIKETFKTSIDEKNKMHFERLIDNINTIHKYASQLDASVRFLLNQSNMRQGDSVQTKVTALLDNSFQLSMEKFKKNFSHQQIVYETNYDLWNQKMKIDPVNMQRAFEMIFDNAIESILEINTDKTVFIIEVETMFDAKEKILHISIKDNGSGIPSNVIGNVFKPFFTTKPQHHGLGLSVVQEIIEKSHLGEITVNSEMGKFTQVNISLPTIDEEALKKQEKQELENAKQEGKE